ncbi:MAG: hypothetical protein AABZ61_11485 [Bacteroidota bacterium]
MDGILKYRLVALVLAVVFGVFNIGIPVIIASCSMPEMMQGGSCPMCGAQDSPATARFSTENTTTCCTTTSIAERNTTAFVQVKERTLESAKQLALVPTLSPITHNVTPVFFARVSSSRPTVVDIPILTSSLLI